MTKKSVKDYGKIRYYIRHFKPDGKTEEDMIVWPERPIPQKQIDVLKRRIRASATARGFNSEKVILIEKNFDGSEEFVVKLFP